jgi:hypothetical protein
MSAVPKVAIVGAGLVSSGSTEPYVRDSRIRLRLGCLTAKRCAGQG